MQNRGVRIELKRRLLRQLKRLLGREVKGKNEWRVREVLEHDGSRKIADAWTLKIDKGASIYLAKMRNFNQFFAFSLSLQIGYTGLDTNNLTYAKKLAIETIINKIEKR